MSFVLIKNGKELTKLQEIFLAKLIAKQCGKTISLMENGQKNAQTFHSIQNLLVSGFVFKIVL